MAATRLLNIQGDYAAARKEYASLRPQAPAARADDAAGADDAASVAGATGGVGADDAASAAPTPGDGEPAASELASINPDYIGWLRMEGADIDYPVVLGQDNAKYLSTTFAGEKHSAGAIFMDFRCAEGFDAPFAILYGHNMKDGSMFAGLKRYLQDGYPAEHPDLTVVSAQGETWVLRVFDVRVTDVRDQAYSLAGGDWQAARDYCAALGMPEDATRIVALSTCTSGERDDERLLVLAAARP